MNKNWYVNWKPNFDNTEISKEAILIGYSGVTPVNLSYKQAIDFLNEKINLDLYFNNVNLEDIYMMRLKLIKLIKEINIYYNIPYDFLDNYCFKYGMDLIEEI